MVRNMMKEQKLRYLCLIITASLILVLTSLFSYLYYNYYFSGRVFQFDVDGLKNLLFFFGLLIVLSVFMLFSAFYKKFDNIFAIIQVTFLFFNFPTLYINYDYNSDYEILIEVVIISIIVLIPFIIYY